MPGLMEVIKRAVNRPVPDLPVTTEGDTDIVAKAQIGNGGSQAGHPAGGFAGQLTATFVNQGDAPACPKCGHIAVRNGACFKCLNCGESLGCS